ncbi:MAG: hypothetical protein ACRDLF_01190, partial [Solirubrobacteraceae bacterium]
ALIASLAAMPTASALASAGQSGAGSSDSAAAASAQGRSTASVLPRVAPGELLPAGELESLLSTLPLNDLSAAQLAHYLAGLEGVSVLADLEVGLLSGKQLGVAGLEESLRKAIEQLGPAAKLGELAQVKGLLPALETALEGKLGGLLSVLLGALPGGEAGLKGALGSLSLDQLAGSLLSSTKPAEPLATELSALAGGLFGELGTEGKLGGLLGSELTGPFAPMSVQEVAEELQTTSKAVSEELGQTAAQLPATATMLTAPLTKGKLMGVAPALDGLALGLLGGGTSETPGEDEPGKKSGEGGGKGSGEGKGGSGEGSGKGSGEGTGSGGSGAGGQGGPGGTGSGGSAGGVTVLLSLPASPTQGTAATAAHKAGKVTILSHRVRGGLATIVLRVPTAGRVSITGRGVRSAVRDAAKAERLTLRVSLSKAAASSLRHSHRRLPVKLKASFKPTAGTGSSATITVRFA